MSEEMKMAIAVIKQQTARNIANDITESIKNHYGIEIEEGSECWNFIRARIRTEL